MTDFNLNPAEFFALYKEFTDKKLVEKMRKDLPSGDHTVEKRVVLTVRGSLNVSEDFQQQATVRLSAPKLVTAFVRVMREEGLSSQKIQALLDLVIAETLSPTEKASKEQNDQAKRDYDRVAKVIAKNLPKEDRKGQVRWKGLAETEKAKQTFPRAAVL